jgi:hypothetical protein
MALYSKPVFFSTEIIDVIEVSTKRPITKKPVTNFTSLQNPVLVWLKRSCTHQLKRIEISILCNLLD